jgi:hypothetical protein
MCTRQQTSLRVEAAQHACTRCVALAYNPRTSTTQATADPMNPLRRHVTRHAAHGLRILLSLLILAQGLLPLQAHTILEHNAHGHVIVVCTWQGPRSETLALPGDSPAAPADRPTPAMLFSEALASADLPHLPPLPLALYTVSQSAAEHVSTLRVSPRLSAHPIRAPPPGLRFTA